MHIPSHAVQFQFNLLSTNKTICFKAAAAEARLKKIQQFQQATTDLWAN
jgi:hypothetical protein